MLIMKKIITSLVLTIFVISPVYAQSYLTLLGLTQDQNFISRVEMALVQAAMYIRIESSAIQYHPQRTYLAGVIINNPRQLASQFAVTIVTDPVFVGAITCSGTPQACTTTVTDAQIYAVVSAQLNQWAVQ